MSTEPERFFGPPTSTSGTFSNWVGVFLDPSGDDEVDWGEIAAIIEEAYCLVAPKELVAQLESGDRRQSPGRGSRGTARPHRPPCDTRRMRS